MSTKPGQSHDKRLLGAHRELPAGRDGAGRRNGRCRAHEGHPAGRTLESTPGQHLLDRFDREMEARGLAFVRYADDIAIFVHSSGAAERVKESVVRWLEESLAGAGQPEKSGAGLCEDSSLLGFRLHRDGRVSVSPKAQAKLKERVREIWNARQSGTSVELRKRWREYIEGWWNYFRLADTWELRSIGKWTRRHMRKCFWQRWHNKQGRYKALWRLGLRGRGLCVAASASEPGGWAASMHVQRALTKAKLNAHSFVIPWETRTVLKRTKCPVQPPDAADPACPVVWEG